MPPRLFAHSPSQSSRKLVETVHLPGATFPIWFSISPADQEFAAVDAQRPLLSGGDVGRHVSSG
jgi:hypothetical protein